MKIKDLFIPPKVSRGYLRVWQRNMLHYRKTWVVNLLWTCLEPVMYLGAIGYGLGAYVSNMAGGSYIEFFFPGILAYTAMFVPFVESTYGNFTKLNYQKTYATIMLTRVSPEEIVMGEMLWTATKGLLGTLGVVLVAAFFGLVDTWRILPAMFILFAVSWLFSGLGMIVTTMVRNYDSFVYFMSGFIIPMSLIAGIYYPIEQLPDGLRHFSWALPLTHAVAAVRELLSKGFSWPVALHFALLLLLGWMVMNIAVRRLRTILVK